MSNDDQTQIIQCVSCSARLRLGANARGKNIACPKCGQHIQVKEPAAPAAPVKQRVVATPIAAPTSQTRPPAMGSTGASANTSPSASGSLWSDTQYPASSSPNQYYAPPARAGSAVRSKSRLGLWIAIGCTALVLMIGIGVTGLILWSSARQPVAANPNPNLPTSTPTRPPTRPQPGSGRFANGPAAGVSTLPGRERDLPPLGVARNFRDVSLYRVTVPRDGRLPMRMNIFVPKGQHADRSLPVMLESPAGTNLLHGADIGIPREQSEILPFTDVGMITVTFSIDGAIPRSVTPGTEDYMDFLSRAYDQFTKADAGVESGKLAIDYVLDKLPAADPSKIYIWGHSSSATLSLLLASKDSRISKCIALAPITDLNARLGEILSEPSMKQLLPNLPEYFKSGSPSTYVNQIKCPILLVHARDDDNEPFRNSERYVEAVREVGGNVQFETLTRGGHYDELLQVGLSKAVEWVQQ